MYHSNRRNRLRFALPISNYVTIILGSFNILFYFCIRATYFHGVAYAEEINRDFLSGDWSRDLNGCKRTLAYKVYQRLFQRSSIQKINLKIVDMSDSFSFISRCCWTWFKRNWSCIFIRSKKLISPLFTIRNDFIAIKLSFSSRD